MGTHLAVVLPGGNNDPWTPPVLLPALALEQEGAIIERISYTGLTAKGLGVEESAEFNTAVAERVAAVIGRHHPDKVTFVAKSRGTLFLAAMSKSIVGCPVDVIWVTTPLVGLDYVRDGIVNKGWRSLLVAGSADPYHEPSIHVEICAAIDAEELVIRNGNHGLVVDGDVLATADGYRQLAEASLSFVGAST